MEKINIELFDKELDDMIKTLLTFENFDKIFKKKLPKDLTKYIYDYIEPLFCNECGNCCKLCLYYCSIDCLRFENRDICCSYELKTIMRNYDDNIGYEEITSESESDENDDLDV